MALNPNGEAAPPPRRVTVLGSTGSVGTSTMALLEAAPPGRFAVEALVAGRDVAALAGDPEDVATAITAGNINTKLISAKRKLAAGPATAILNSARGLSGSLRKRARPPNGCNTISSISIPSARPISACDSSWLSTDRNSPMVVIIARIHAVVTLTGIS